MEKWDILGKKVGKVSVFKIYLPKSVDIFPWTYLTNRLRQNLNFLFVCPSAGSFVHWKMEMCDIFVSFQDIFTKIGGHLALDLSHRLAEKKVEFFVCVSVSWFICSLKPGKFGYFGKESWKKFSIFKISLPKLVDIFPWTYLTDWLKQNFNFLFVCPSVGSFVHWKMEMCDILVSFQDIFTKIGRHLPLDQSHELVQIKFQIFVCVSVSWFICSLKHWKVGYFGKESWKIFSVFKIYLPKLVDIFPWTYLSDWLKQNLIFCLCVH